MELKTHNWVAMGISLVVLLSSLFMESGSMSFFLIGIAVIIGAGPIVLSIMQESAMDAEKEEMFLEFSRNLVESVKAGNPISKSILNIKNKHYGALSVHVRKLANQISIGIPLNVALRTFSIDVKNKSISRALVLIGQAERAGGNISEILEAVAEAVNMSDKLKKERKAAIHALVVQGYIIFFVFIVIVLVMQFKIVPMVGGMSGAGAVGGLGIGIGGGGDIDPEEISGAFLYLLLIQGFFTGLTIGKLAEGNIKLGIKHSFTLMLMSFLFATGANILFM